MSLIGVDANSIKATQPLEMLLVSSGSADPHSTIVIDPRTGVSSWSYKGSELQGALTGLVEPLGIDGDHLIITTKDRPIVHVIAVNNKDRFHQKAVLPGPVSAVCSDKNGRMVFMAIKKQIYAWLMATGELLTVIEAHYQNITRLALSSDDSILFSSSKDGAIHAYLVVDLISADRERTVALIRKWNAHTLAVTDLQVTYGANPRVLSCGADHMACMHSMSLDSTILKISSDRPLSSCCIDSAETRVFIGTDLGNIAQINLFQLGSERDILVQTNDEKNTKFHIFSGHSEEISMLTVNTDGSLLASGDISGKYYIWEIGSHQCLKVSTMRSSIFSLKFIPYWNSISSAEHIAKVRPVWELQRESSKNKNLAIELASEINLDKDYWAGVIDQTLEHLLSEEAIHVPPQPNLGNKIVEGAKETDSAPKVIEVIDLRDDDGEGAPIIGGKQLKKKKNKKKKKHIENHPVPVDVPAPAVAESDTVRAPAASSQEIEALKKEIVRLKEVNRQMYEFVAKEVMAVANVEMAVFCFDVILSHLNNEKDPPVPPQIPDVKLPLFVTWKKGPNHDLRGCIGTFSDMRLSKGLAEYAAISAFRDTRFNPIVKEEVPLLQCGVSLLVKFEETSHYKDWQVGVHGVRMDFNDNGRNRSAVFLPEVAAEQGWDHIATIDNLIRKSGSSARIDEGLRESLHIVRFQSSKIVLDYKDYVEYKKSNGLPLPH
ncbi:unnamed protein product [Caenorhabditis bovis]|uniref:AMMECR1 domain-containing protein n=1 Tax=Caenorhabditis bovis TaxID=2654633 RepID=A0A8S1ERC6_9PELO|nr:unnamed protein product [Caenorhabditis bovis]